MYIHEHGTRCACDEAWWVWLCLLLQLWTGPRACGGCGVVVALCPCAPGLTPPSCLRGLTSLSLTHIAPGYLANIDCALVVQGATELAGTLQCEAPSQNLHSFQGRFIPRSSGVPWRPDLGLTAATCGFFFFGAATVLLGYSAQQVWPWAVLRVPGTGSTAYETACRAPDGYSRSCDACGL